MFRSEGNYSRSRLISLAVTLFIFLLRSAGTRVIASDFGTRSYESLGSCPMSMGAIRSMYVAISHFDFFSLCSHINPLLE